MMMKMYSILGDLYVIWEDPIPIEITVTPKPITLSTADTAAPTDIPVVLIPVIQCC